LVQERQCAYTIGPTSASAERISVKLLFFAPAL
jgi:hypothetical protein